MGKLSKFFITTATFLTMASFAGANTGSTTPLNNIKQQIKDARLEAKEQIQDIKDNLASTTRSLKALAQERMQKGRKHRFDKTVERLEATIEREEKIIDKLTSRIEKIKSAGGKTTDPEKFLAEAKTHLEMAKTSLNSLRSLVENAISEETSTSTRKISKETLDALKKASQEVEKHIKECHRTLERSLGSLKGASSLKNASSTKENI